MNILVTGANGQLGNSIRIASVSALDKFIFTDVCEERAESVAMLNRLSAGKASVTTQPLDITDLEAVRRFVSENKIQVIVNCAAYTNVDAAESDYDLAELLNAKAPENLALAMKEVDGLLIHISTDYVFGKELYNKPCTEDQKGLPSGVYGLTKLHGEQNIIASGCKHIILRTAWLYSEFGKNFVKTMLNLISTRPQIKVVFDQAGTPTYAGDLAGVIVQIIANRWYEQHTGIFNYSNEGVCSWFDFTKVIAQMADNKECDIRPCYSEEYPSPVQRPAYSVLDKTKIKDVLGISIPYWTESLRVCIQHLLSNE